MKNNIKLLLCCSILFMLNSCSKVFYFYIQNNTSEDQKITLIFYKDVNSEDLQHKIRLLSSKVTRFKDFRKAGDKIKLQYTVEDNNKISVILPRNSFTNIDYRSNHYTNIKAIEYAKNKSVIQLSEEQFIMMAKREKYAAIFEMN